jgi:large subunit ribosomal protein L4e
MQSIFDLLTIYLCHLYQEEAANVKAAGKAWYKTMISDSDYTEFDVFSKWLGVSQ